MVFFYHDVSGRPSIMLFFSSGIYDVRRARSTAERLLDSSFEPLVRSYSNLLSYDSVFVRGLQSYSVQALWADQSLVWFPMRDLSDERAIATTLLAFGFALELTIQNFKAGGRLIWGGSCTASWSISISGSCIFCRPSYHTFQVHFKSILVLTTFQSLAEPCKGGILAERAC